MAEFVEIKTQEEFDARIMARLERERNKIRDEYADYADLKSSIDKLNNQLKTERDKSTAYEAQIGELNNKIKNHEIDAAKTRIALEAGLPYELRDRLTGENDEEIKADAEALKKYINPISSAPLYRTENDSVKASGDAALMALIRQLD